MVSFLTVCLNPVLQKTLLLPRLRENEVNRSAEYYFDASGKGVNVSRVLTQAGERVIHLTHAGGVYKQLFLEKCTKDNLIIEYADSNSEIRFCYTLLNRAKGSTTEIVEEARPVSPATEEAILTLYRKRLPASDRIIISGTKAEGYSKELYPRMVKEAKDQNKRIILDIKGEELINCLPYRPDFIKPNYTEFKTTFFDAPPGSESDADESFLPIIAKKCRQIFTRFGTYTVLTRGAHETLYFDGKKMKALSFDPLIPLNSTGCGDAFTAGFASAMAQPTDLPGAITRGHLWAGKNALLIKPGAIR